MPTTPINTANTLSVAFSPGENIMFPTTSSESIFTFGDYSIDVSAEADNLTGTSLGLSFSSFSTLENLGVSDFNPKIYTSVQNNELRPVASDPHSYTYFGSFYTEISRSINNILDNFPFAALAYDNLTGVTVYDYSQSFDSITGKKTSNFKIPSNVIINQGFILFDSGSTAGNQLSLMTQTNLFEVQLSGLTSASTSSFGIKSYSFTGGVNSILEFTINGHLTEGAVVSITGTTSNLPVYIRPSKKRTTEYKMQQSRLERQLLNTGLFDIPDVDNERVDYTYRIPWPRTIDGFNPDLTGSIFETYQKNILILAGNVDMDKTDIMIKTIIPDNFIDFDSNTQIYSKLISSYAKQFDEIKQFIDNIAYGHSINYNNEESIPEKFLVKLSNLFGWKLSSSFSQIDLFQYLSDDENNNQNSFAYYNVELWKRILININWLYKKKGTRDALQFLFKLMGAPESLISFDEFVYDINQTVTSSIINSVPKSNERGFINYDSSEYIFQEGGKERGDGQKYINQWRPEFNPLKRNDNIKIQVGDTGFTGSENILNTKEICIAISPASAIESDVFTYYQQSGTCWVWGTNESPVFSALTVPFEYTIPNCDFVNPDMITGMTFNDYLDFIYTSNIEPRNRKTNSQVHTSWNYPELKRIYMNYYLMSEPQSNQLTFKKLESFLDLIEVNFRDYVFQLLPATTILECQGTEYRNTLFNRQRFVYKEGINQGSEFQIHFQPDLKPSLKPVKISSTINGFLHAQKVPIIINSQISQGITNSMSVVSIKGYINANNFTSIIPAFTTGGGTQPGVSSTTFIPIL